MKLLQSIKLGLGLSALLMAALPQAAFAVESGGIGGRPALPRADNPRSTSIFVYELKPGATVQDKLRVINTSNEPRTVALYAVDSQISSDGAFACAQNAEKPQAVGTWIKLAKSTVNLPAMGSTLVDIQVTVPKGAPAGEQNGCIAMQAVDQKPQLQGNGIALSFRSAIRVAVTVPGAITKGLDFTMLDVASKDTDMMKVKIGLKNKGNVSLDTQLDLRVKSLLGFGVHKADANFPVLAGNAATFNFEYKKPFWGGWYITSAAASYNEDASKSLGETGAQKQILSDKKTIWISPQPLALVIEVAAAVLICGLLGFWFVRRRLAHKLELSAMPYTVKKSDTIQAIAKKQQVSWKTIAKLNRLKAPYHLEAGQRIKIPPKKG